MASSAQISRFLWAQDMHVNAIAKGNAEIDKEIAAAVKFAEIAALITEELMDVLDRPIIRVTAPDTPIPFSPVLEDEFVPSEDKIITAIRSLM